MYTILKPLKIREKLLDQGIKVFTLKEFTQVNGIASYKAKQFLEKQEGDLVIRLKKGLYALKTDIPSEEEIANKLCRPSYISFEYAMAYWGIIPEMIYSVTSATTKSTRSFVVNNKNFSYLTIKKEAYTGYELVKKEDRVFLIADPEKALIDYLYFFTLGKKPNNDRLRVSKLNKEKLIEYAKLYSKNNLMKLIERSL